MKLLEILKAQRQEQPAAAPNQERETTPPLALVHSAPAAAPEEQVDFAKKYLKSLQPSGRATMRSALKRAAIALDTTPEEMRWDLLRAAQVEEVRDTLRAAGHEPATTNTTLSALKGVAHKVWLAEKMSDKDYHLILDVHGYKKRRLPRGRMLDISELEALMQVCQQSPSPATGARDWAAIALMCGAGLRRAEAVRVEMEDLDLETFTLHVRGKGDNDRKVFFEDGGSRDALRDWLNFRGTAAGKILCPVHKSGTIRIEEMTTQSIYDMLKRRATEAGLKSFSPHDLRRTFGSHILNEGGDLSTLQRLMGHVCIETTVTYDLRPEDAQRRTAGLMHMPTSHRSRRKPRGSHRRKRKAPRTPIKYSKKFMRRAALKALGLEEEGEHETTPN